MEAIAGILIFCLLDFSYRKLIFKTRLYKTVEIGFIFIECLIEDSEKGINIQFHEFFQQK